MQLDLIAAYHTVKYEDWRKINSYVTFEVAGSCFCVTGSTSGTLSKAARISRTFSGK